MGDGTDESELSDFGDDMLDVLVKELIEDIAAIEQELGSEGSAIAAKRKAEGAIRTYTLLCLGVQQRRGAHRQLIEQNYPEGPADPFTAWLDLEYPGTFEQGRFTFAWSHPPSNVFNSTSFHILAVKLVNDTAFQESCNVRFVTQDIPMIERILASQFDHLKHKRRRSLGV